MLASDVPSNKDFGTQCPYNDKIGIVHRIDDIAPSGNPLSWTGALIAVIGQNLLFEKRNGRRVLVDPTKVIRIIELPPVWRQ